MSVHNRMDLVMRKDPLELTKQDLDLIIAYLHNKRGTKPLKWTDDLSKEIIHLSLAAERPKAALSMKRRKV